MKSFLTALSPTCDCKRRLFEKNRCIFNDGAWVYCGCGFIELVIGNQGSGISPDYSIFDSGTCVFLSKTVGVLRHLISYVDGGLRVGIRDQVSGISKKIFTDS